MPIGLTYHSGKNTRMFISNSAAIAAGGTGAVELDLISFSTNANSRVVNFETSRTGDFQYGEATFKSNSLNMVLEPNFDQLSFGTNGGNLSVLNSGTMSIAVYLNVPYPNAPGATDRAFLFPNCFTVATPFSVAVSDKMASSCSLHINGPWTEPT